MNIKTFFPFLVISVGCNTVAASVDNDAGSNDNITPAISSSDSGANVFVDSGSITNIDGGKDASIIDAAIDVNVDATIADSGIDSGVDAGVDAGPIILHNDGQSCKLGSDCVSGFCNYNNICVPSSEKTCINYLGGNSCGAGEIGDPAAIHESCCKSLPVPGLIDPVSNKSVYIDKYEITAGRMRAFVNAVIQEEGKPDFKSWVAKHRPATWDDNWTKFLPSDYEGDSIVINRLLLGDPRGIPGPGVILPPATDQVVSTGLNHQFNGTIFTDLHGNNCSASAGSWGFPTYYYPANVQIANGEVARINPTDLNNVVLNAQDALDVKSMNCATNMMFHLFCSFDGGELMSTEVFDYITNTPQHWIGIASCGSQFFNHADLLNAITATSVFIGGRCPDAYNGGVNLFFDAGQDLPVAVPWLNYNSYNYPNYNNSPDDKAWVVAAPGRMVKDIVRTMPADEGWHDLSGNLVETTLDKTGGIFSGNFSVRGFGIGVGSEMSDLNVSLMAGEVIPRVQRPDVKSALVGARCQRYK